MAQSGSFLTKNIVILVIVKKQAIQWLDSSLGQLREPHHDSEIIWPKKRFYPDYRSTHLYKPTSLDLAFGGHPRYILPHISPSQPVVADNSIICRGIFLNFCLLCLLSLLSWLSFFVVFPFFPVFSYFLYMYEYVIVEYLQQYREHNTAQSPQYKAANQVRADQSTCQTKYICTVRTYAYRDTCIRRPGCFPGACIALGICQSPVCN